MTSVNTGLPTRARPAPISVSELVGMAHLSLEVLAGDGGLRNNITWAHVSDTEDCVAWLDPGDMLITSGIGLPKTEGAQARYIQRLVERRAAALAVRIRGPELKPLMLETADELMLPVLRIKADVPYLAISHLVATANQHAAQRKLVRHVQIFDTLRPRNGVRLARADLFAELQEISGYHLAVVSPKARPLFPDLGWTPAGVGSDLLSGVTRDHFAMPGGYVLPVQVGERIAAFLVGIEQPGREPAGLSALRHIVTIVALEVAEAYRARDTRRRTGAETLTALLEGDLGAEEVCCRLGAEQMPTDNLVLVAVRALDREIDDEVLSHRLYDEGFEHIMVRKDELFLLVCAREVESFAELAQELDLVVGVSAKLHAPTGLALARHEALWSLARTSAAPERRVAFFGEMDHYAHWLPADLGALRQMVTATVGPIEAYDAANNTALLRSLEVFFRHQRRLAAAAAELYVHKHTLAYRLRRIEELTGRDLNDLQDMAELWLSLKALPVVRGTADDLHD